MAPYLSKIRAASPITLTMKRELRLERIVAYPGWRWRFANDGTMHHEKIPNPVARFFDWAWRSRLGLSNKW